MRRLIFCAAAAAVLAGPIAAADPVTVSQIAFAPDLQETFEEEYGVREQDTLRGIIARALTQATESGPDGLSIDVTVVEAMPNRPTLLQARGQPGLDTFRSLSIGGAKFTGVVRDANNTVVAEITHEFRENDIAQAVGASTWSDARRAAQGFARKVARATQG
jgi:hypothetical protein